MSRLGLSPSENVLAWHHSTNGSIHPRQKCTLGLESFSIIRNPWSRLVSVYLFCMKKHPTDPIIRRRYRFERFDLWVESLRKEYGSTPPDKDDKNESDYFWLAPQHDWLFSESNKPTVNHIVKLEEIDAGLIGLASKMGFGWRKDNIQKNSTNHAHYSMYYTKTSTINFVYDWYVRDIMFGYDFRSVKFF